jgi:hypothetical protein
MANTFETGSTVYTSRQRAVSLTLGVACSIPLSSTLALAHGSMPTPTVGPSYHTVSSSVVGHPLVHGNPVSVHTSVLAGGTSGNLNLASSSLSFLANNLANFSSLSIDVGGHQESVNLTTKLTAAEVVAVEQVITGGSAGAQTIKIGANGVADGGTVSLNNNMLTALDNSLGGSIGSMTIARGVQLVDSVSSLSLSGNLSNYGSILTASGSSGSSDTISANSIFNAGGAAIGSYTGGGAGGNALFAANPVLNAATSLTNNGTISSAGNLTISAPVVSNVSSHGSAASINAAQNVNINTQSLNNSGSIAAVAGNVNLASSGGLNFTGTGGTLQANNGNINLSSSDADIDVNGGNMLSQQVNFNAGTGNVTAQMDQVTGVVNATGTSVHVGAETANLNLGTIDASGDPTITNTGNLLIDNTITGTSGVDLALIAGGNIVSVTGNTGINLSSATANGGNLSLIAGAAFTPFTTTTAASPQPGSTVVTKASATGGIIDLTGLNIDSSGSTAALTSINTSSTFATASAGSNVQMVAFAGKTVGSGSVFAAGVPITSTTAATGASGAVTIIAGAKSGTSVTTGATTANSVTVDTSTPVIVPTKGVTGVVFDLNGNQIDGTFAGTATANAASATLGNTVGTLNINTGGSATVTNAASPLTLGTITVGKTGTFQANDTGAAGNITITGNIGGGTSTFTTTAAGTTTGTGSVNTTTLNLDTGAGVDTINTNVTTLNLNTGGGSVNLTQAAGTKEANTLGLSGTVGGGGDLTITSTGQINVTGALFDVNNILSLSTTGKGGINIGANMLMGTGTVNLTNTATSTGKLTESKGIVVAAKSINLTSSESFGAKTLPFLTNATNLSVIDNGTKNSAYVSDQNNVTLNFQGNPATTSGSLFLTSVANLLDVNSANYNTVSITDNMANGAGITFASGSMGGTGTFTVVSGSTINSKGVNIFGSTVTLTGTTGVGTLLNPIGLQSPNLVLNSSLGNVFATDNLAATVNGSASLTGIFSVTDTGPGTGKGNDSLTVGKSVGGGTIDLTSTKGNIALTGTTGTSTTNVVNINSGTFGISTKGAVNGSTIGFTAGGPITVGGSVGNAVSAIVLTSTSLSGMTVGGALAGNNITLKATAGPLTITKSISGTGPNSKVTLEGDSATPFGNAVVIGGAITGGTINVGLVAGGQGNIAINAAVGNTASASTTISSASTGAGGGLTGTGLVSGTSVTLSANTSIGTSAKPISTSAGTLSANETGVATGDGAFVTQKGNLALGTSDDNNLVVKVTGTLDVTGVVTSANQTLTSTGTTTIDGTVTNGGAAGGAITITSGGPFTVNGTLTSTGPVTVGVTGATVVNGNISVQTLNLKGSNGFTVATTGVVSDGTDNLTVTGPFVVNGQLGNANGSTVFNVNDTGSVVIGQASQKATIVGTGKIEGLSIINYVTLSGSVSFIGTGAGNAFQNYGTITGLQPSVTTTNKAGVIYNAPGAVIEAQQVALNGGPPILTLNTYAVNNLGTIGAVGLVEGAQGVLNIVSPGTLAISGINGGFLVGGYNAVNLTAKGNVTVGGIVGGVNSNPFSNLSPVSQLATGNYLGTFTVNTTGTFSSTMGSSGGVSVLTQTTGAFGGNIAITASNILYNGVGTAPTFGLSATGAGVLVSTSKAPILVDLTGSQGITVGSAPNDLTVNVEGFGNTSLNTLTTPRGIDHKYGQL